MGPLETPHLAARPSTTGMRNPPMLHDMKDVSSLGIEADGRGVLLIVGVFLLIKENV